MAASRSRRSPELAATVEAALRRWLDPGEPLCLAFSGGRDSLALLQLLADLAPRWPLSAIHVHHGLSPNAERWAASCQAACDRLGVPLQIVRVEVRQAPGEGLEAAARRARYAAFAGVAVDALALAHHAGDQAETLLFRLARGSGVLGAAGIPPCRALPRAGRPPLRLLRPMLEIAPEAIATFVAARGLAHIDDESNADPRYVRNFLRHDVLPRLASRIPGAGAHLAAAAARFREAADLLDDLAAIDAAACSGRRGLTLQAFRALAEPRQRNLLAGQLRAAGARVPAAATLVEIRRQLLGSAADREVRCEIDGLVLHLWRGEFELAAALPAPAAARVWAGEASLPWAGGELRFAPVRGQGIAAARLAAAPVTLRPRAGGERLRPDPRRPRRSLKNLFQEMGCPPWEREQLPLLWSGERLVWVAGIGIDADYQAAATDAGWHVCWTPGRAPAA